MYRAARNLALGMVLSALGVACSMQQTNGLPESDVPAAGGGGGDQGSGSGSQGSGSSASGDDGSGSTGSNGSNDDGGLTPVQPAADAAPPADEVVKSFTLINADQDVPIAGFDPITEGATIKLADLPTQNLNIRANAVSMSGKVIGSVVFDLDGQANFHTEGTAPYALGGDDTGDYNPLTPPLAAGAHKLTATPYSDANGAGTAGQAATVNFTIQ